MSSADGQLKGKYHRECFNCHTCHVRPFLPVSRSLYKLRAVLQQKPFPDKEFYVFDGKPFCAYHYHEANDSLCAARTCGQPIEGACAVAHTGERYHPEHLTCEYEYPARRGSGASERLRSDSDANSEPRTDVKVRCEERLEEYWEVDGRMLCERHAGGFEDDGELELDRVGALDSEREARAMRRVTRFIDLR